MTLFTVEGLVRAHVRGMLKGICSPPGVVLHAYLRWLLTQGVTPIAKVASGEAWPDGWLVKERGLWARRSPGHTSLKALAACVDLGERADNLSKGCGALMRVAPVGLLAHARGDGGTSPAFDLGVETSALTHGHPASTLSSGALALLVALLAEGLEMRGAVDAMYRFLADVPGSGFVTRSVDRALSLAAEGGEPTAKNVESLGGGSVAEEALAIAVYTALVAGDFEHGLQIAMFRPRVARSAGALVGSILGVQLGVEAIPQPWLAAIELRAVIHQLAEDLARTRDETFDCEGEWERYPGW